MTPLHYLAYFPAAVFLGKTSGNELITGLWMQLAWVIVLLVVARAVFHLGVRRYAGYGG
jgi:ABC-2 type transport system permease protein